MLREAMNVNVKINIMISRDPIPYKEEYAQVSYIPRKIERMHLRLYQTLKHQ